MDNYSHCCVTYHMYLYAVTSANPKNYASAIKFAFHLMIRTENISGLQLCCHMYIFHWKLLQWIYTYWLWLIDLQLSCNPFRVAYINALHILVYHMNHQNHSLETTCFTIQQVYHFPMESFYFCNQAVKDIFDGTDFELNVLERCCSEAKSTIVLQ